MPFITKKFLMQCEKKSHSLPGRNFSINISFFLASNSGLRSHEWYQSFSEEVHH